MLTRTRHARMPDHTQLKHAVRALRVPPVFVQQLPPSDSEAKHLARIQELEAEAAQARLEAATAKQQLHAAASQAWLEAEARLQQENIALDRAHREARLEKLTKRVVDRTKEWYAKQPKARSPHVILSPERMITCETWEPPQLD